MGYRKAAVAGILVFWLVCTAWTALAEEMGVFTVRNGIMLGMTQEEVIACEGAKPDRVEGNTLYYPNQTAAGRKAIVNYVLNAEGKLFAIYITFTRKHENPDAYLPEYDDVDAALLQKYKTPKYSPEYLWLDPLYETLGEPYGQAIANGHARLLSSWEFADFQINHALMRIDGVIRHTIHYYMPAYAPAINTDGM